MAFTLEHIDVLRQNSDYDDDDDDQCMRRVQSLPCKLQHSLPFGSHAYPPHVQGVQEDDGDHDDLTCRDRVRSTPCAKKSQRPRQLEAATPAKPWFNRKPPADTTPPQCRRTKATFADVLQHRLQGARLANLDVGETPNLYFCMGFASQGYEDWASIESALSIWCDANDERHRSEGTGWILLTNGDGDYGKATVETIAQFVKSRGTPVVFVQSDFAYCEPGSAYWPTYASAGFFGEGIFHDLDKVDNKTGLPCLDADGTRKKRECWGGFAKDSKGQRDGRLSYPDAAVLNETFGSVSLAPLMGGIFVAGGGDIACEQVELYGWTGAREGDCFVPANAEDGTPSKLNSLLGGQPWTVWP